MSIADGAAIKEIRAQLSRLEQRVKELEANRLEVTHEVPVLTSSFLGDLRASYEKKFGKKPHHLMKDSTIEEALKE